MSDGSLLGDPGSTPLSKKQGVKWQRPRLTRQALMRCCLVKWILSSAAPQGSGRGWGGAGGSVLGSVLPVASETALGPQPRPHHLCLYQEMCFHSLCPFSVIHAGPTKGADREGPCWRFRLGSWEGGADSEADRPGCTHLPCWVTWGWDSSFPSLL